MERGEKHQRQIRAEQDSEDGLWRSAGAIRCRPRYRKNLIGRDPRGAKSVPDLQAPGRYGATLLNFAVMQSWQVRSQSRRLELAFVWCRSEYREGSRNSSAMANAVHAVGASSPRDAGEGGNPTLVMSFGPAHNSHETGIWVITKIRRDRELELLLDHALMSIPRWPRMSRILRLSVAPGPHENGTR